MWPRGGIVVSACYNFATGACRWIKRIITSEQTPCLDRAMTIDGTSSPYCTDDSPGSHRTHIGRICRGHSSGAVDASGCAAADAVPLPPHHHQASRLPRAEGFELPVVGGGDRHGRVPNAIVNLTNSTCLAEFASELRKGRATPFASRACLGCNRSGHCSAWPCLASIACCSSNPFLSQPEGGRSPCPRQSVQSCPRQSLADL